MTDLYIPKDAIQQDTVHEIIALVGAPGCGKSTSALTFPNRIWGDADHKVPQGEITIPFWSPNFVANQKLKVRCHTDPINFRDSIKKFHRDELPKFSSSQTFIDDSWTEIVRMANRMIRHEEGLLDKENYHFFWGQLKKFCEEMHSFIKDAPCRMVVTFHETMEWHESKPTGKLKVVQDGQFKDQVFAIFSDVWRCVNGIRVTTKDKGGKDVHTKVEGRYWQVLGDASFDANANRILSPILRRHGIKYIPVVIDPQSGAVSGGYQAIERIYREENLEVENGILKL